MNILSQPLRTGTAHFFVALLQALIVAVLIAGCSVGVEPESETQTQVLSSAYFPLEPGNRWAYQSRSVDSSGDHWRDTLTVFGTARIEGTEYAMFWNENSPFYLRADERGRILRYDGGKEQVWLDVMLDDGAAYDYAYELGGSEYVYTITVEHLGRLETPARIFEDCIRFAFDDHAARDDEHSYTVAEGVGIIERSSHWTGPWQLADFQRMVR